MGLFDSIQDLVGGVADSAQGALGDVVDQVAGGEILADVTAQAEEAVGGATEAASGLTEQGQNIVDDITQNIGL